MSLHLLKSYVPIPGAADDIIIASSLDQVSAIRLDNPAVSDTPKAEYSAAGWKAKAPKPPSGKAWHVDPSAMQLYGGAEKLLVRTALLRAPGWKGESFVVDGPSAIRDRCEFLRHTDQEHMVVFCLNARNHCVAIYEATKGSVSETAFKLRDLVKTVILTNSSGAIVVHNHPSGRGQPSLDDDAATLNIATAMACLGLALLDHIIVGAEYAADYSYFDHRPDLLKGKLARVRGLDVGRIVGLAPERARPHQELLLGHVAPELLRELGQRSRLERFIAAVGDEPTAQQVAVRRRLVCAERELHELDGELKELVGVSAHHQTQRAVAGDRGRRHAVEVVPNEGSVAHRCHS